MSEIDNRRLQQSESLLIELFEFCQSESISEDGLREIIEQHDGLREIIERHGLTTQNLSSFHLGRFRFFHAACINERVTEGIIRCLLEYFPAAASAVVDDGWSPLHAACQNPNMAFSIIQLLIDAAPNTVRSVNHKGFMPLHCLCTNRKLDDKKSIDILKLLIQKHPGAVRHADIQGYLPIHYIACGWGRRSPEFCRVLIEAYPGSERITASNGMLPFHFSCMNNTVPTVEYLYGLYPDAINYTTTDGDYPIHYAIIGMNNRDNPTGAKEIVEYLLDCDPNVKFQKVNGESLLHITCQWDYTDSKIHVALEMIKIIYDANPEAIEDDTFASNIHRYHQQVQSFLNGELVYSRQAKNLRQMTTPDDNGRLPLHTALQINVRLGSIKLLVKGNPHALQTHDNSGTLPLHVACQHHNSTKVIQYLVGLDTSILDAIDRKGDTALHYACRSAKYDNIALLLEKYDAVSVSKRNAHGKLPIDLLWESNAVEDRESIEYTESVFRLLTAYPEMMMNYNLDMKQQGTSNRCSTQNGKKRKLYAV